MKAGRDAEGDTKMSIRTHFEPGLAEDGQWVVVYMPRTRPFDLVAWRRPIAYFNCTYNGLKGRNELMSFIKHRGHRANNTVSCSSLDRR